MSNVNIFQFYIDAPGCSCIVFFAKADSPFRTLCLKILSNLSKSQNSPDFLRSADAITTACSLITNQNLGICLTHTSISNSLLNLCILCRSTVKRVGGKALHKYYMLTSR